MMGSSAAMCADVGPQESRQVNSVDGARSHAYKLKPPRAGDGLRPDLCRRCGFVGPHPTPGECIDALRDRIAVLSCQQHTRRKRLEASATAKAKPKAQAAF